jgi:SAM-dependent methyltransferase
MPPTLHRDYTTVTELPAARASRQQWARLRHRYGLAATLSVGRDVLEVGCGAGLGLGWLARQARRVTGGDCTASSLALARRHYRGRVPLLRLDAQTLPFRERSFDAVILFETVYYLRHPAGFVAECARVLRPGGLLLIGSVNPDAAGFHPSPFARRYFSAGELRELLRGGGFSAEISGGFREAAASWRERCLASLKRIAGRAGLIPKTMRGRETLKRLVFGRLTTLPPEILPQDYAYEPPAPMDPAGLDPAGLDPTGLDPTGHDPPGRDLPGHGRSRTQTWPARNGASTGPACNATAEPEGNGTSTGPACNVTAEPEGNGTGRERDYTILYALGRLKAAP